MKIIKPGREQKGWSIETRCSGKGNGGGGCDAVLLVEEGDLFITTSSFCGESERYVTFKCCACGVLTDLSSVPGHIWESAAKNARPA